LAFFAPGCFAGLASPVTQLRIASSSWPLNRDSGAGRDCSGSESVFKGFAADATIERRMEIADTWQGTCTCVANAETGLYQNVPAPEWNKILARPGAGDQIGTPRRCSLHSHRQPFQTLDASVRSANGLHTLTPEIMDQLTVTAASGMRSR